LSSDSSLLQSPADRRVLPSFPTRRSSDLASNHACFDGAGMLGDHAQVQAAVIHQQAHARLQRLDDLRVRQVDPRAVTRCRVEIQDRKSTRLNSSHVKISYAVFCLKKKKST